MKNHIASIIMAAGRGSRMKGCQGNKTLLPLVPDKNPLTGSHPILINIIRNLPEGPKAIIVHHKKEDVKRALRGIEDIRFCEQKILNGTGGALLCAKDFIREVSSQFMIITMGDVPLVKASTYLKLLDALAGANMVVLAFRTESKKQYGMLRTSGDLVEEIIEWKYWSKMPLAEQNQLHLCNSGIYAARKSDLTESLAALSQRPHVVEKEIGGKMVQFEEFFITDLVTIMNDNGKKVAYVVAEDEYEVMGVDDLESLAIAQKIFNSKMS